MEKEKDEEWTVNSWLAVVLQGDPGSGGGRTKRAGSGRGIGAHGTSDPVDEWVVPECCFVAFDGSWYVH